MIERNGDFQTDWLIEERLNNGIDIAMYVFLNLPIVLITRVISEDTQQHYWHYIKMETNMEVRKIITIIHYYIL